MPKSFCLSPQWIIVFCFQRYELNDKSRWMEIYQAMQNGWEGKPRSLISCHLKPDPEVLEAKTSTGLVRGHAYSVTKVVRAKVDTGNRKGEFPLVRVRNPWGEKVRVTCTNSISFHGRKSVTDDLFCRSGRVPGATAQLFGSSYRKAKRNGLGLISMTRTENST